MKIDQMVRKFTCRASLHAFHVRRSRQNFNVEESETMPEPHVTKGTGASSRTSVLNSISARELVIVGAGGFGAVAASVADDINAAAIERDCAAPWDVIGYADLDTTKRGALRGGRTVRGTLEEVGRDFHDRELWFLCAIGDNRARAKMVRLAEEFGWKAATLVHPTALVDSTVKVGPGSFIGPLSTISVNAEIGSHVVIDTHVSVGHDAVIKDYCAVSPGARITGYCCLEESVFIGCNAALFPGTHVGERAVVGASSLACRSVEADTTVLGVPARTIYRRRN
jgi:sugar O-acyltransferase (sialic acid O-acetyltransferase NeuD family)